MNGTLTALEISFENFKECRGIEIAHCTTREVQRPHEFIKLTNV